jgi:pyruvate dehydrogenase E2 component (dihydrolipoamide acetyltransferase)
MAEVVSMPKLGFDMAEGTLVRWVVAEGSQIAKGNVLAEIETDKATVEVESAYEGVVLRYLVKEGDIVPVNTPIAVIGAEGESVDLKALGLQAGEAEEAKPLALKPEKTAKAIETRETVSNEAAEAPHDVFVQPSEEEALMPGGVRISPLARKMAKQRGIDLRKVKGSGPNGRIIKADIETFREEAPKVESRPITEVTQSVFGEPLADQIVPLSRLRSAIGRRMVESKQQVPHFYVTHEYNMAGLMALRKQINTYIPEAEKISVNDFIVKAVAMTLRAFPNLNASLNEKKTEVVRHGAINVGVAVAVENGLLTVVCHAADRKPLRQIAVELKGMAGRVQDGKVRPEDIEGSTFSTSNLGMFEVEHFAAIINPPEAAILAIGSVKEVPVVESGELKVGIRMRATLSVDHRVSDGVEAAKFLQELAKYLEEPLRLLIL